MEIKIKIRNNNYDHKETKGCDNRIKRKLFLLALCVCLPLFLCFCFCFFFAFDFAPQWLQKGMEERRIGRLKATANLVLSEREMWGGRRGRSAKQCNGKHTPTQSHT